LIQLQSIYLEQVGGLIEIVRFDRILYWHLIDPLWGLHKVNAPNRISQAADRQVHAPNRIELG
jgi:hypothetical protein